MPTVGVYLLSVKVVRLTGLGVTGDDIRVVARTENKKGLDITTNAEREDGWTVVHWPPKDRGPWTVQNGGRIRGPWELFKVQVQNGADEVSFNTDVMVVEENIQPIADGITLVGTVSLWFFLIPAVPFIMATGTVDQAKDLVDSLVDEGVEGLGLRDRLMKTIQVYVVDKSVCTNPPSVKGWFSPPPGIPVRDSAHAYTFKTVIDNHGGTWEVEICVVRDCPNGSSVSVPNGEEDSSAIILPTGENEQ